MMERPRLDVSGKWQNQHGSVLELEVLSEGKLGGTFKSGIGFVSPDEVFAVTGFVSDGLVAFAVNFAKYDCLTSWSGHVSEGANGPELHTLWHMVSAPRPERNLWKAIWTGADIFRREVAVAAKTDLGGHVPSHPISWREMHDVLGAMAGMAGQADD